MNSHILIDSHAHLNMKEFDRDRDEVIERAKQKGIKTVLCPIEITDPKNIKTTLGLLQKHKNILAAGGAHPHHAKEYDPDCEKKTRDLAKAGKIKAVGEIGLDFHYNLSPPSIQISVFRRQLETAQDLDLPVVIHSRNAGSEIYAIIQEVQFSLGGILHCFTEDLDFAEKMINHNFIISFSGILTYPNAHSLRETAQKIPLDKLLVETDSPFLVPVPLRGKQKRNEPAFVQEVAECLAGLKTTPFEEVAKTTSENFQSLFGIEINNLGC
jgi:TatD DNase family protein